VVVAAVAAASAVAAVAVAIAVIAVASVAVVTVAKLTAQPTTVSLVSKRTEFPRTKPEGASSFLFFHPANPTRARAKVVICSGSAEKLGDGFLQEGTKRTKATKTSNDLRAFVDLLFFVSRFEGSSQCVGELISVSLDGIAGRVAPGVCHPLDDTGRGWR
jgi:hypothetical protein